MQALHSRVCKLFANAQVHEVSSPGLELHVVCSKCLGAELQLHLNFLESEALETNESMGLLKPNA